MNIPANATGIERTVCTYRITSRQGRKILGRGNPLARGLDANRSVKRRAVTNILGAGPDLGLTPDQLAELSHALYLEDAALHQLGHLRMTGAHQAATLTKDGWTETGPRGGQTERDACPNCPTPEESNR